MSEKQSEIDALLAEVNALAEEAVSELSAPVAVAPPPPPAAHAGARRSGAGLSAAGSRGAGNIGRVLQLEVPVIVRLAERCMPLSEILNLTSGAIIEFEKPSDGELDLLINNKCIGHGLAVKVSENFGLRISQIGTIEDRIKALGG